MPYQDPDGTDPLTLNGVEVVLDDIDAQREMALCFIEEYIRLGFDRTRLVRLFQTRGYAGPHLAWRALGEAVIVRMIDESLARWGPRLPADRMLTRDAAGHVSLPVLT